MLFNKDGFGAVELQKITGVYSASNDYSSIASEIDNAMVTVDAAIGNGILARAEATYQSSSIPSAYDTELMNAVRAAVAALALSVYMRGNIVSHDDSGSKIKVDDNEKVPFEWMIDRDAREMRERYYRAMDRLYSIISKDSTYSIQPLKDKTIIRTLADFETVYPLEGSYYTFYMLVPLIYEAQSEGLKKVLGKERLTALMGDTPDEDALRLSRRFVVLSAVRSAVKRWSLAVFPFGVARRFMPTYQGNNSSTAAQIKEMQWYLNELDSSISETRDALLEQLSGEGRYDGYQMIPDNDPHNKFFTAQ